MHKNPHLATNFIRKYGVFLLAIISGCGGIPESRKFDENIPWNIKILIKKNESSPGFCDLRISMLNNTKIIYLNSDVHFILFNKSGVMKADVAYDVDGTILPGYAMSVKKSVRIDCEDITAAQFMKLKLSSNSATYSMRKFPVEIN